MGITAKQKLEQVQGLISDYYSRAGNDYGKAGQLYSSETSNQYNTWHDLVRKRDELKKLAPDVVVERGSSDAERSVNARNTGRTMRSWEEVRQQLQRINGLPQEQLIAEYQSMFNPDARFSIIDKKNARMYSYSGGRKIMDVPISLGANRSDAQTTTKVSSRIAGQRLTQDQINRADYKVDWDAGNFSTGAGRYFVSNVDPSGYHGMTIVNMMNEAQNERFRQTGQIENVGTSIHYGKRPTERKSHGCINVDPNNLDDVANCMAKGEEVFILPEDSGNRFKVAGGKLLLDVGSGQNYASYTDRRGETQTGQGINRSVNALQYQPTTFRVDKDEFIRKYGHIRYMNVAKPFADALTDNKRAIMKAAKINSDVYNEVARAAFGVLGTETEYGDRNSIVGNVLRGVRKIFNRRDSSGPDYAMEGLFARAGLLSKTNSSIGLTQMRWSYLNADEKAALKQVGVNNAMDMMSPAKSAIATATVLGVRYNQQLTRAQRENVRTELPARWNNRDNYPGRVNANARLLDIETLGY